MRAGCVLPTKNTLVLEQPEYEYYAIGPFAVDAIDNIAGGDDAALAVIDGDTEDVIDGIAVSKGYILAATNDIGMVSYLLQQSEVGFHDDVVEDLFIEQCSFGPFGLRLVYENP